MEGRHDGCKGMGWSGAGGEGRKVLANGGGRVGPNPGVLGQHTCTQGGKHCTLTLQSGGVKLGCTMLLLAILSWGACRGWVDAGLGYELLGKWGTPVGRLPKLKRPEEAPPINTCMPG